MFSLEGRLISHTGEKQARVEVDTETGRIMRVGKPTGAADLVLQKELVFPGFIDVHVHAREDASRQQTHKEDFQTLGQAALHGGVCFAADMPNNPIPPVSDAAYGQKQKIASRCPVAVTLYAGIGPHTEPLQQKVPYKAFMGPSVGDLFFTNFADLEKVISRYRGQHVSFHCENPGLVSETGRPPEAEVSAIQFALELIQKYGLQGNICHCSTRQGIEIIAAAKRQGIAVTGEVTPHHLYFDQSMLNDENRIWLRVNPPIRAKEDRLALVEALRNGTIDYLASDHAPHTKEEKQRGISGMPHLDTYGAFCAWLMQEHSFTTQDIARVCAYNPGQFVNQFLAEKYGEIKKGYAGSFCVISPNKPWLVREEDLQTKCGWSPFSGIEFPGQVVYTIHKGTILYRAQ